MSVNAFFIHPKYGLCVRKSSFADKPYSLDWSGWGSIITASVWVADPGITLGTNNFTNTLTTVGIAGGTDMNRYRVTNNVTFASGLKESCSFYVIVDPT